jgi:ankyrin repeat protein
LLLALSSRPWASAEPAGHEIVPSPPVPAAAEIAGLSGAELNARLHTIVKAPDQLGVVRALLAAGADPLDRVGTGDSPFIASIASGHTDYAEAMLEARPGLCDKFWKGDLDTTTVGMAALYAAAQSGETRFALRLLENEGVVPTSWRPAYFSDTPSVLGLAVRHWDEALVRKLIGAGAVFVSGEGFFNLLEAYAPRRDARSRIQELGHEIDLRRAEMQKSIQERTRPGGAATAGAETSNRPETRTSTLPAMPPPVGGGGEPSPQQRVAFERMQEFRKQAELRHAEMRKRIQERARPEGAAADDPGAMVKPHAQRMTSSAAATSFAKNMEPVPLQRLRVLASIHAPGKNTAPGINDLRIDGRTPLSLAVERGWTDVVSILVAAGADLQRGAVNGRSVGDFAADNPAMMRALAGKSAEGSASGGVDGADYVAAIHRADKAMWQATPLTPELLAFRDPKGKTLLHHSIEVSADELALRLIEAGAAIDVPAASGQTPLVYAAFLGRHEIMRVLLARKARPDGASDGKGYPPLIAAASRGDATAVRMLLSAGANPSARDANGMPVVVSAAMHSKSVEPVRLLVEAGAGLADHVDVNGYAMGPLEATFVKDHADSLAFLLSRGAPWSYARADGDTPLMVAARNKAWKCARLLLDGGERDDRVLALAEDPVFKAALEDVLQASGSRALDDAELWPAIFADKENWRARADAHLAQGGNVNYRAATWTPLLRAIETGNLDFVRHLLAKGADPRIHPLDRYEDDPATLDYLHMGRFLPRGMSAEQYDAYWAALIRLLVPLEPRSGRFNDYERRLASAIRTKRWGQAEAYVAAGVATDEALEIIPELVDFTESERRRALELLNGAARLAP